MSWWALLRCCDPSVSACFPVWDPVSWGRRVWLLRAMGEWEHFHALKTRRKSGNRQLLGPSAKCRIHGKQSLRGGHREPPARCGTISTRACEDTTCALKELNGTGQRSRSHGWPAGARCSSPRRFPWVTALRCPRTNVSPPRPRSLIRPQSRRHEQSGRPGRHFGLDGYATFWKPGLFLEAVEKQTSPHQIALRE